MRQATYTPGPWRVTGDIFGDNPAIESEEYVIAELPTVGDGSAPHTEANARLIASAPELLYALQELVKEVPLSKLNVRKDFSLMNAHAYASKVIHHATGRQAGKG